MTPSLVGVAEIAAMVGVSRARVHELTRDEHRARARHPFPRPVARLAMGPVWRTRDVREWIEERERRSTSTRERS